jgi:hypothetical protein
VDEACDARNRTVNAADIQYPTVLRRGLSRGRVGRGDPVRLAVIGGAVIVVFVIAAVFSPTVVPRRLVTRSSALDSRFVRQRLSAAAFWAVLLRRYVTRFSSSTSRSRFAVALAWRIFSWALTDFWRYLQSGSLPLQA